VFSSSSELVQTSPLFNVTAVEQNKLNIQWDPFLLHFSPRRRSSPTMTHLTALLNTRPLNPKASHTNVSEETLTDDLTRATLGQLCGALWDSQSRPVVMQAGIKPGSVVTPLALRCSALDCCATREALTGNILIFHPNSVCHGLSNPVPAANQCLI
jgi:hypothetical protein